MLSPASRSSVTARAFTSATLPPSASLHVMAVTFQFVSRACVSR